MNAGLEKARTRLADPAAAAPLARRPSFGAAGPRVAVLIPCFNEEAAVSRVIAAFRATVPEATIYVY
ncbi:MAG: glycosyl transferase, partial [Acetobacteraceae bacterium]